MQSVVCFDVEQGCLSEGMVQGSVTQQDRPRTGGRAIAAHARTILSLAKSRDLGHKQ